MTNKLHLEAIHLPADWIGQCFAKPHGDVTSLYVSRASEATPVRIANGGPLNADVIRALAVALNDAWRTGRGLTPKPDPEPYEVPFGQEVPMRRQSAQRLLLNTFGAASIVTFMQHASNVARETDPLLKDLVWQRGSRGYMVEYRLLDQTGNVIAADVESNKALRAARAARLAGIDAWCMPLEDFELTSLAIPVTREAEERSPGCWSLKARTPRLVPRTSAPCGLNSDESTTGLPLGRMRSNSRRARNGSRRRSQRF
ncbi:hypothetical protein [Cupriavidus pinatubonensis]|uniref:hypothetical protein n=1 Tax=Cupriavidus pinatubonensis TaxID=248026 RepID=UPI00112E55EF|nr:hypothetical protein [Cupriavidus pinatubonensis]TPQ30011.1 hypothetical protein C2U69_32035 [Cupriavidus pinatubonensis]